METTSPNHETHLMSLWANNDEGIYLHWKAEGRSVARSATMLDGAVCELANAMKEYFEREAEEKVPAGFLTDLMNTALANVDWEYVAEDFIDEDDFNSDEEDEENTDDDCDNADGPDYCKP